MPKRQLADHQLPVDKRFGWLKLAAIIGIVAIVSVGVTKVLLESRLFRPPYPTFGKQVAWMVGSQERAYNFDIVRNGAIYRSSNPDAAFLAYLKNEYGITTILSLAGPQPWFEDAEQLGMTVHKYKWGTSKLPPIEELKEVELLMEGADAKHPVLVHCSAGADRTGYAIAVYRVKTQEWSLSDAVDEMRNYWHYPETKDILHKQIKHYLMPPVETANAESLAMPPLMK
ncbi:dual specificity protein phosphatase family protein [Planctomycetota bacterium]|nr:dual specificity protein phosphatase family protein [Planctomycetota bacterium]